MSVHLITIKDGAKFMRPVLTRDEYVKLRDSEKNRKATKMKLVQFNYSCLPNVGNAENGGNVENQGCGPLRGSTRVSKSVGMDVDLDENTNENEKRTHVIEERILANKEELGLLMLEKSATKGFHLVFRRHLDMTQEGNLRWASELIGVKFDDGAKDITRVFFTPADKLIFLDDELFDNEEAEVHVENVGNGGNVENHSQTPNSSLLTPNFESATMQSLAAFDMCVENAGLNPEEMDVWGVRNWHSNLMAVLSVGLPKLMSREQLMAVINEKLPNYAQTDDCRKLIDYFFEKYSADKGFMTAKLREINAKAQAVGSGKVEESEDEKDADWLREGWTPPALPRKVPKLLRLLVGNYDSRFKEMLMLSALPVLSAHASHFRARYLNGKIIGPQQFVAVIGQSGSGKGTCTDLFNEMIKYTLHANDDKEWEKVRENAELRDKKANAKERPQKYHPRFRTFETTSKTSILELQTNLGPNGMLLGMFSESDGLSNGARASFSDITVELRKGWDGDMIRQFYMSDATCNTYTRMCISLLMAGTVKAMLERLFSDKNCESGLMQRFIPVIVPKHRRTFRPPMQNFLTDEEIKERDNLLIELYGKDLELGDDVKVLETPMMNRAIGQWFDSLEERYNDGLMTEAEADLSHRCGEFMLRAAIPLIALYGGETKEIVDFCRWVGETAHYTMCYIFGQRVQRDIVSANEMLSEKTDGRMIAEPLLAKMPEIFTLAQFREQRIQEGQSPESKTLLTRYCKKGRLERIGRGLYRKKSVIVSDTKICDPNSTDEVDAVRSEELEVRSEEVLIDDNPG